jgi:methylthioribose-1-phosphate isomerase
MSDEDERPSQTSKTLEERYAIRQEDIQTNKTISRIGNAIVPLRGDNLTMHTRLATEGWGTALG